MFLDYCTWSKESMVWIKLDVVLFVINTQAIVNGIIARRSISIEGTFEVMRYLMRYKTSVRSNLSRYYYFVSVR